MSFASIYIEQRIVFPRFINELPDSKTGIITIVPSYGEDGIVRLLNSLVSADKPGCEVEVIIVVNAPADASPESLEKNRQTLIDIESWKLQETNCWFRLFCIDVKPGAVPGWGVGLARKTGMDEAIRRFSEIENPDGIILNLDADCKVGKNYFSAVYSEFRNIIEHKACSIYFEHCLEGQEFPDKTYHYITLYELHLRYYFQGIKYTGFPWVFHTIGSAMAVRAREYIAAGGMNRRQAGEDFYLIQKLVPSGGYFSLNSTIVYPSPRPSFRVPFGTGAAIEKLTGDEASTFYTYNPEAFEELRIFFNRMGMFYDCSMDELDGIYTDLPPGVKLFINEKEWIEKLMEIKDNTSGPGSFSKRFFGWFNMLKIVRYLNTVHQEIFSKVPVEIAAGLFLERLGSDIITGNPRDLLGLYRKMEKNA